MKLGHFWVSGVPVGQGSMRSFRSATTGKQIMPQSRALVAWRAHVAAGARAERNRTGTPKLTGALRLAVMFALPRPESNLDPYPIRKHDLDKLLRAVGDALTGVVYADDGQVIELEGVKLWAGDDGPGARILIEEF